MNRRAQDSTEVAAARIELLVLAAAHPPGILDSHTLGLGGREMGSVDSVAQALSSILKPVTCTAELAGTKLMINCEPLTSEQLEHHSLYVAAMDRSWAADRRPGRNLAHEIVLVVGSDRSLYVPGEAVQRWYRDYEMKDWLALGGREATGPEMAKGASYVITASFASEVSPDSLPPWVRRP